MSNFGVNHNIKTPYVTNWNLNLEHTLWQDAGITMAYVGTKGNRLYSIRDINQNVYANDFWEMNNRDART